MKASLKFRDDQRPLARAKIPISILGIPFLAGAAAGDPHDLHLDLTTAFESGPAFRLSYRPNESSTPFTISIKTGIGAFGSPVSAPLSMITEFNLFSSHSGSGSPAFSVVFKPRLGDFCFRKSASSLSSSGRILPVSEGGEMFPPSHSPAPGTNGIHSGGKVNGILVGFPSARGGIGGVLSGIEVMARSVLPVCNRAAIGFRWGFRIPTDLRSSFSVDAFSRISLPMLVMNKISIDYIPVAARSKLVKNCGPYAAASSEVTEACKSVRKEIEMLQFESETLRKTVEDIRDKMDSSGLPSRKLSPATTTETKKGGLRVLPPPEQSKRERHNEVKSALEAGNEELKKALLSANAPGRLNN